VYCQRRRPGRLSKLLGRSLLQHRVLQRSADAALSAMAAAVCQRPHPADRPRRALNLSLTRLSACRALLGTSWLSPDAGVGLCAQVLGQRWLFLPLASLWVGGSLAVTVGLAGAFIFWALLVLVADSAAIAFTHDKLARPPLCAAAVATAATPAVGALVLSRSPMFGGQLAVAGLLCAAATLCMATRASCASEGAAAKLGKVAVIWGVVESVFGVAAGFGLNFAATSLVSDEMDVTGAVSVALAFAHCPGAFLPSVPRPVFPRLALSLMQLLLFSFHLSR
jgi:hypothetical protein